MWRMNSTGMVVATAEARERLRASEFEYRTLLQNLPVAVVVPRPRRDGGNVQRRACALLRMTPEQ